MTIKKVKKELTHWNFTMLLNSLISNLFFLTLRMLIYYCTFVIVGIMTMWNYFHVFQCSCAAIRRKCLSCSNRKLLQLIKHQRNDHRDHQKNYYYLLRYYYSFFAIFSSIIKLNNEKCTTCVFSNKTLYYDISFFPQRVGRRIQKRFPSCDQTFNDC